jgi:hypothetical protein
MVMATLLVLGCAAEDQETYPVRAGEPCRLGSPAACGDEGFQINCEPARFVDARTKEYFTSIGYLGIWQLNTDSTCEATGPAVR